MPMIRPSRSGFLPSLADIFGATCAAPNSEAASFALTPCPVVASIEISPAARTPVEV